MSLNENMNAFQVNSEFSKLIDRTDKNIISNLFISDLNLETLKNENIINLTILNQLKIKPFYKEFTESISDLDLNTLKADNNSNIDFNNCNIIDIEIRNYRITNYPIETWQINNKDYQRWFNIRLPLDLSEIKVNLNINNDPYDETSIEFINKNNISVLKFSIENEGGSLPSDEQTPFIKIFWY